MCSFLVFSKRNLKKRSIILDLLLRNFVTGSATANPSIAGTIVPATAKITVLVFESPSLIPSGIASLISKNGVIAVKKTVSSGGM